MTTHEACVQRDALLPSDFLQNPKLRAAIAACQRPELDPGYADMVARHILQLGEGAFVQATPLRKDAQGGRGEGDDDGVEANVDADLFEMLKEDTEQWEMRSHVRAWLHRLDQREKAVFRLLYEEGLSHTEASRVLGVSRSTLATAHDRLLELGRVAFA